MLKDHISTHGIKLYKCQYCQKKYGTWSNMHKHIQNHKLELGDPTAKPRSEKNSGPAVCNLCFKVFSSQGSMRVHKHDVHTNLDGFLCTICGKKINNRVSMAEHLKTHNTAGKFKCELCYKSYNSVKVLKAHMETHNKKQFECMICSKKCPSTIFLKAHVKTHL